MVNKASNTPALRMDAAAGSNRRNIWARLQGQASRLPAWLVIAFCAGTFLIMNLLTPVIGDDYAYAFIWDGAQNGNFQNNIGKLYRVESFGDIIASQWSHYLTWGGRSLSLIHI